PSADGFTHASIVAPLVRSSGPLSGATTLLEKPLNASAVPYLPAVQTVFEATPGSPRPDESAATLPVPSSNEYAAARPVLSAPGSTGALKTSSWTLPFELFSIT